ncbi:MAG: TetR/AcrR family transcriptional regulator [Paludibacteraceae bacterium]|nr:TetR/AcrR family transcriptional regulator [Paludibacteraceae bacterium]
MEEQKQLIINTALEQFKKYGIRSVSIDDISRQLSMSKKTFYQFFPGKEELVAAVLEQMIIRSKQYAEKYMKGKTAIECISMIMDIHNKVSDVHKEPSFSYDLRKYYPQLYKEHIHNVNLSTKEVIMHHLQQGKDEGVYREDLDVEMCAVMYSLIQQAIMRNEYEIRTVSPKRLIRFTMESFFRSIISEEGIKKAQLLYDKIKINNN